MSVHSLLVPDVRKIAVLRANGIGDYVFTLPALEALRAAYPAAEIVLLGRAWHAEFLKDRPGPIDRVVIVPPSRGVNGDEQQIDDVEALEDFYARMRAERFDLALQLHGGGRYSNPFVRRLGARFTIGLRSEEAEPLDRNVPYFYLQSEWVRYLEVVALAGAPALELMPQLALCPADRAEAHEVLGTVERPLVLLHPGATDPRRHWPVERFAAVGQALADVGATVLVNGTAGERSLCEGLSAEIPGARNLCDRLSLNGLVGVLARCSLVVANDTGPLHLAVALGTPTVSIFWCLNLLNGGMLSRTWHRPFVSCRTQCPVCGVDCLRGQCSHDASFVADVELAPVRAEALRLYRQRVEHEAGVSGRI